jgi:hypothetical protein
MIFKKPTLFEKDFAMISGLYPKLSYTRDERHNCWLISGELDICNTTGLYWDTFKIAIGIGQPYPTKVPDVFEISHIIPRTKEWHISEQGECCLDIPHNLKLAFQRGMRLPGFMYEKVYPYFANQLHRLSGHPYAGDEYGHHFAGVIQYYKDELAIASPELAVIIINAVLAKSTFGRNDNCLCGSGKKNKKCHLPAINTLSELGPTVLTEDLIGFTQLLANSVPII